MFQTNSINTVADCNTILADAGQIKSSLEFRQTSLQRQLDTHQDSATELPADLAKITEELQSNQALFDSMQNSVRREDLGMLINQQENEKRSLQQRMARYGPTGYLTKSKNFAYVVACLTKINEAIAAVDARKTELTNAAAA